MRDDPAEFRPIANPRRVRRVGRIDGKLLEPQHPAKRGKLTVVAAGDDHVTVRRRKDLVGHDVRICISNPAGRLAGGEIVHRLVRQDGHPAIEKRKVDMLAPARPCPLCKSRLDPDHAIQPGEDVYPGDAHLLRLALGLAGQVHDPAHPLDQEVVARKGGHRAGLPETRHRGIDQARIDRSNALVIKPELSQAAELEVLDHHVRLGDELLDAGKIVGISEIAGDGLLAAVRAVEIGG